MKKEDLIHYKEVLVSKKNELLNYTETHIKQIDFSVSTPPVLVNNKPYTAFSNHYLVDP